MAPVNALTQKVGPDVARLGVNPEDGLGTRIKGVEGRSVSLHQKVVVLQPFGQRMKVRHFPGRFPHFAHELLGLFGGALREGHVHVTVIFIHGARFTTLHGVRQYGVHGVLHLELETISSAM